MIVVDTSALVAILDKEPDAQLYAEAIAEADPPMVSAPNLLELNVVMLHRHGVKAAPIVDRLIQEGGFQVESFTAQHAELARDAYARYGKGQQPAPPGEFGGGVQSLQTLHWRIFIILTRKSGPLRG